MQDLVALKTLTKKLEEIKESWQIYAIFEDARKAFNAEFDELKKDKEKLIESFNATSAKNAMLLAQNKELEAKNKALLLQNRALESLDNPNNSAQETQNLELLDNPKQDSTNADSIHREKAENTESQNIASLDSLIETQDLHTLNDLSPLYTQCQTLQETLKSIQAIFSTIPPSPKPLTKLFVTYQQHQRVKANPAENYVPLEIASAFFGALENVESKVKILDLEVDKLLIEMRDMLQIHTESQDIAQDSTQESDILDDTDSIKDNV